MGKPTITEIDLCRAARRLATSTAEVEAFLAVETKGRGFDAEGRPTVLFERHWFHKLTKGRFDRSHPDLSSSEPGGYGKAAEQYQRFSRAFALDPEAAMMATSWGLGQVMGFNYAVCGYPSVGEFVDAMKQSEGRQLDAAVEFVIHNGLDDELREHDWRAFARGYNGRNYEKNDYHTKLKTAYTKFAKRKINCAEVSAAATGPSEAPPNGPLPGAASVQTGSSTVPSTLPVPPPSLIPVPTPVVEVEQVKPETETDKDVSGIQASTAGAVTFITTTLGGLVTFLSGYGWQIVLGVAVFGGIFVVARFWYANREKERQFQARLQREAQAHEIQMATLKAASDPNLNTVRVVPQPIANSDPVGVNL